MNLNYLKYHSIYLGHPFHRCVTISAPGLTFDKEYDCGNYESLSKLMEDIDHDFPDMSTNKFLVIMEYFREKSEFFQNSDKF